MELNTSYNIDFPKEIHHEIFSYVSMEAAKQCELVCTLWNKIINQKENYQQKKELFFANKLIPSFELICPELIDAIGIKKYYWLPILDIGEKTSSTAYLDFIRYDELTAPIMRGVDCKRRPFTCIKINVRKVTKLQDIRDKKFSITLFNRYIDEVSYRCCGGEAFNDPFGSSYGIPTIAWQRIKSLIKAGECEMESFEDDDDDGHLVKYYFQLAN